jgi:hypothetical protein
MAELAGTLGKGFRRSSTEGDDLTGKHKLRLIRWVYASPTAGHICEIRDSDGNTVFYSVAPATTAHESTMSYEGKWVNGLDLFNLDGGIVFVVLDSN